MPVVEEADDGAVLAAAAGGGEAVNLGVARAKGETKEEKKARKEAVKLQVRLLLPLLLLPLTPLHAPIGRSSAYLLLTVVLCHSYSLSPPHAPPPPLFLPPHRDQPTVLPKNNSKKRTRPYVTPPLVADTSASPLLPLTAILERPSVARL
jgi:hypothetical protein